MSAYGDEDWMAGGMYFTRDVRNILRHLRDADLIKEHVHGKHTLVIGTQVRACGEKYSNTHLPVWARGRA